MKSTGQDILQSRLASLARPSVAKGGFPLHFQLQGRTIISPCEIDLFQRLQNKARLYKTTGLSYSIVDCDIG